MAMIVHFNTPVTEMIAEALILAEGENKIIDYIQLDLEESKAFYEEQRHYMEMFGRHRRYYRGVRIVLDGEKDYCG
jgi:hypothetical protein